ncbi:MAG: hypothetical protein CMJ23_07095 [Phycisphaerae bacterium]|nr:hypothetical protein [Phycisphaerae bacterium]
MNAPIRWRLSKATPEAYSATKRFIDAWFCDPEFAPRFHDDPGAAVESLGIDLDPVELGYLVAPGQVELLTDPVREGAPAPEGRLAASWRNHAIERYRAVGRERAERSPTCPSLATWRWRQMARLKFELAPSSAGQIRHIPFAIELTRGCSGRCWFCGISAEPLTGVFERTEENIALFRGLLSHLRAAFGPAAAGDGILYWATDPMDHPEYEAFVDDYAGIIGVAPSTVTALAGRDPERAASILASLSRYPARPHRFSLLSPKDYRTIIARFDPDELASVELLPQFRKDLALKFAAGRARARMKQGQKTGTEPRAGTIACLSGLLVDLVDKTIRIVTPCSSSEHRPDGVHESVRVPFRDLPDGIRVIDELLGHLKFTIPSGDSTLERSPLVRFENGSQPGVARVHSPHHAVRLQVPLEEGVRLDSLLPQQGSADEIFGAIETATGAEPDECLSLLRTLLDSGIYRSRLPGEDEVPVDLGLPAISRAAQPPAAAS